MGGGDQGWSGASARLERERKKRKRPPLSHSFSILSLPTANSHVVAPDDLEACQRLLLDAGLWGKKYGTGWDRERKYREKS